MFHCVRIDQHNYMHSSYLEIRTMVQSIYTTFERCLLVAFETMTSSPIDDTKTTESTVFGTFCVNLSGVLQE